MAELLRKNIITYGVRISNAGNNNFNAEDFEKSNFKEHLETLKLDRFCFRKNYIFSVRKHLLHRIKLCNIFNGKGCQL